MDDLIRKINTGCATTDDWKQFFELDWDNPKCIDNALSLVELSQLYYVPVIDIVHIVLQKGSQSQIQRLFKWQKTLLQECQAALNTNHT